MRLLIIGGTRFVGRHLMEAALARGDQVTLFNRGLSAKFPLPPAVECRQGDRRADLSALESGEWDAVIDTCGYLPGEVGAMARCLAGRVGRYAFISSVSVYAGFAQANTEDSPLARIDDADTTVVDGRTYGPLKALCEAEVSAIHGARALLIRPGLVVGPHDPTQRFTWWPARLHRAAQDGEPVLAPGAPEALVQFIDARDLAAFVLNALSAELSGPFNAIAAPGLWTFADVLASCARAAHAHAPVIWAPSNWLVAQSVNPWVDLPLWLPADGEHAHFMASSTARAQAAGLRIRPLDETVTDTLDWWRALPAGERSFDKAGLTAGRERELLALLA